MFVSEDIFDPVYCCFGVNEFLIRLADACSGQDPREYILALLLSLLFLPEPYSLLVDPGQQCPSMEYGLIGVWFEIERAADALDELMDVLLEGCECHVGLICL